ncbi:DUF6471 domain-containing protein [Arcobacter sp. F2176]|uniref:DUF6471 domain-containing protein n=1 Tax=Arcobacter sp. F2176 TaxID=2044511 RepID=UPI00100B2F5C|nr:DUF6471 domain-containing protein [Arcobacter sp. F2176]RXJ81040.1 hypothetical protein CRU95_08970 [Arcobacter sp. F2176]
MIDKKWSNYIKSLLKAEIKKKNITYEQLSIKLKNLGVLETPESINTKINRGTFSSVFFIQCLLAIDVQKIKFERP